VKKGVLLDYVVLKEGKMADPEKVEVIVNLLPPKDVKGELRVLGHVGYYRELIEDYATKALSLTNLTKKVVKFDWTLKCQQSYDALKVKLTSALVLKPPNWNRPFHVYYDASSVHYKKMATYMTANNDCRIVIPDTYDCSVTKAGWSHFGQVTESH